MSAMADLNMGDWTSCSVPFGCVRTKATGVFGGGRKPPYDQGDEN